MGTFQRRRDDDAMIPVDEAQRRVLDEIDVVAAERVAIDQAHGRVLREDVLAPRDVPPADNSGMDGYAIRAADVGSASEELPAVLRVIDDIPAGVVPQKEVAAGTAARIMTGAPVPRGADSVVRVEWTDGGAAEVRVLRPVAAGANVRRRGDDMREGALVLGAGTQIGAAEIGVLATIQKREVSVGRRLSVAILSTGDELVDIADELVPGKIVNSNAYALSSLVRETGASPRMFAPVRDTREATVAAIENALECDFVISSGGVSAGAYDFVKDALEELGATPRFWKVAMKPGKPVVFTRLRGRVFFGLPGNPVSAMVAFVLFVAPALRKAAGQTASIFPPRVGGVASARFTAGGERTTFQRVRVFARDGVLVAEPMRAQGSHVSTSMLQANGLAVLEMGVTRIEAGEAVPLLLLSLPFSA